jgi:hypothetical protein
MTAPWSVFLIMSDYLLTWDYLIIIVIMLYGGWL